MKLTMEKMRESGTIDYITLLGVIEKLKRSVDATKDYTILLFENVYFMLEYDYTDHECPSRYSLLGHSEFVFRIVSNEIEIMKSAIPVSKARDIFEESGIHVYRTCHMVHLDEE